MLNGRTVVTIVFLGCLAGGISLAQQQSLEQNWNDFLHYTTIGRFDLAKGYAQAIVKNDPNAVALLGFSQANPQGYDLAMQVVDTSHDAELAGLAKQLVVIIDRGRFERRSDPAIIVEEIKRLSGGNLRAKLAAIKRLKDAGEYAIPFMLDALADPARKPEEPNLIEAIPQIGRYAIRPLVAALQTDNSVVKTVIIKALGQIGYTQSLPYLRYVVQKDASAAIRELAGQSMSLIDPKASDMPAAALFYQLSEKYYYHDESLAPQEGAPIANVWLWDKDAAKLVPHKVDRAYFHELMSMQCCEWALKADENYGRAIGLWLAAFFAAETAGVPMPSYFGPNHANALVYATTAGPEYLHQALARALKDRNAAVALGVAEALAVNAGEKSLMYTIGSAQPLLQALSFTDRAVRYTAAIAIANAGPRQPFTESGLVVRNLSEALGASGPPVEPNAPAAEPNAPRAGFWTSEMADIYANRAVAALLKVAVSRNPVIDLSSAQPALVNATKDPRPQIQTMAAQTLAYLDSPNAQRAIAAAALSSTADVSIRVAAFHCLADSAKMHGNLLPDSTISEIYALISSDQTQAELRTAAAGAYGALNLPSQQVRTLILDQAKS